MSESQPSYRRFAMILGVLVALVGSVAFWWPGVASSVFPEGFVARNLAAQAADWVVVGLLLIIIVVGERRGFSSLNIKPLTVPTFFAGLGLGGFMMVGIVLWKIGESALLLGGAPDDSGEPLSTSFILWYAPLALITAGFAEEIIFRGYAMERLLQLNVSPAFVVILTQVSFALYHIKDGWSSVAMVAIVGTLFAVYYLATRNLTVTIIGHLFVDSLAIIGALAERLMP